MSDFCGAEIPRIDFNMITPVQLDLSKCFVEELLHAVRFSGRHNVIIRLRLLQHEPHRLYVVARVTAATSRFEVAHVESMLQAEFDSGGRARDLSADKRFATPGCLVVEE